MLIEMSAIRWRAHEYRDRVRIAMKPLDTRGKKDDVRSRSRGRQLSAALESRRAVPPLDTCTARPPSSQFRWRRSMKTRSVAAFALFVLISAGPVSLLAQTHFASLTGTVTSSDGL